MQDSIVTHFWALLHPLGRTLIIGLVLAVLALRHFFLTLPEKYEKYLRSVALGIQVALLFWPLFPSCIYRGRIDLGLWFLLPLLWVLGGLMHFSIYSFSKVKLPLRDYASAALLSLFFVQWAPIEGIPSASGLVLWSFWSLVFILSLEMSAPRYLLGLPLITFSFGLFGFFFPATVPLLLIFLLGIWSAGLFREALLLFAFFPEGNKRFIPALVAFGLTLSASLTWS